jgi:hypothetical protein
MYVRPLKSLYEMLALRSSAVVVGRGSGSPVHLFEEPEQGVGSTFGLDRVLA